MGGGSYEYEAEEDTCQDIEKAGKALLAAPKGKDALLRLLKGAGESLREAAQTSHTKLAAHNLARALGRPELLRHKDKEVRLYTAFCLAHILRLNAPETPYTDDQLQTIFELLTSTYTGLGDPSAAHFQLCLSVLETVSQVKCSLLILDLPNSVELVCSLFSTLLDAVNEENAEVLAGTVLELLRSLIEEADDLPQQQLDILLARLLPAAAAESPAAHALAVALLQRCETVVQPHLQKLLAALLTGARSESELKDDAHELFYAVHETVPQALLPLEPQLREELEGEAEPGRRSAAAELVAKLLTQHPDGGAKIIDEYEPLLGALLGRANDVDAGVRRKVLDYAGPLMEACGGRTGRQLEVLRMAVGRLHDVDDGVRRAAAAAVGALLQLHPHLARSNHTDGRGPVLNCMFARLRDKKLSVRREVASQLAALLRAWVAAAADSSDGGAAPDTRTMLAVPLVVCNFAARDSELAYHVFDSVWRSGMFPAKLPPANVARLWAQLWLQAGDENQPMLSGLLTGKTDMQLLVQRLLSLRTAAKEQRTASVAAAASSMGGGAASGSAHRGGLPSGASAGAQRASNPDAQLQACTQLLIGLLRDVSKPEDGMQKLLEAKDNHIFRGLATLATHGCTFKDAVAAGKDVLQRVGSKGPAADLVRVLVARLTPNLLPPEVLLAAMEEAEQSNDVQRFLVEIASAAPLLFAQSLDQVLAMFEADDPAVAECAAKVLAWAGHGMRAHCLKSDAAVPEQLVDRLKVMCAEGGPTAVKAAVKAIVVLLPPEIAASAAGELADSLLERLKASAGHAAPATLASHSLLLAALKGLSMVGRLLPEVFEARADEALDFVVADLLEADLSRGRPLPGVEAAPAAAAGRVWRRPSAVTAIKTAALRTLCQMLVPDSPKAPITQAMAERAQLVWELLEPLLDTDEAGPQFRPFCLVLPNVADPEYAELQQHARAKRRRVAGRRGSPEAEAEAEEGDEEGYLECTDAAWVRYSAVCGLLRLARGYDAAMPAPLFANLALTFQEPLLEPRRAMTANLARTVGMLSRCKQASLAQRAAKYAAVLALFAVDPEERNRTAALRALRAFVLDRRRAVGRMAQSTAAAGGGGGTLIQDMPEFMLAYLVFLLAHHPDYPTQERLEEYSQASQEEREEMYGRGGPFAPFMGMLQFALEALAVPAEHPTSAAEVARLLPPGIKLLRTLKFCDDASSEPRTEEAHQLCDLALMLFKQIAGRLTKGKPLDPGRFPGQMVLPKLFFKPNMLQAKRTDGSNLPPARYFVPALYEDDLFLRRQAPVRAGHRLLMPALPGPAAKGRKPRAKAGSQRQGRADAAASGAAEEEMPEAAEEESVGGTPEPESNDEEAQQQPIGKAGGGKRKQPCSSDGRGKRNRQRGEGDSRAESAGGTADNEGPAAAPRAKKGSGGKRGGAGRPKPAPTPTRQQPRRGAKSEVAGKLKDASDAEDESGEGWTDDGSQERPTQQQQQQQRGGRRAARPDASPAKAAADDPMAHSDFENVSMGSPEATPGRVVRTAVAAAVVVCGLTAETEDEEESQPSRQRQRRQPVGAGEPRSPGQENLSAGNGGTVAARVGGAKPRAPAAKKKGQAGGEGRPLAARSQPARGRA